MVLDLMAAFLAMSNVVGVQPNTTTYNYQNSSIVYAYEGINVNVNSNEFSIGTDIYDFSCSNRYLEVYYANDYYIYDKKNEKIVSVLDESPYSNNDVVKFLNINMNDEIYIEYNNNQLIDVETDNAFSIYVSDFVSSSELDEDYYYIYGYEGVTLIEDYYYFHNLNHYHALNTDGTCAVVAAEIVLGYYDTFYNDNIVDEIYDISVSENKNYVSDFKQSPGTGKDGYITLDYEIDNEFHDLLFDIAVENGKNPNNQGMTMNQQKNMISTYLNDMDIEHSISEYYSNTNISIKNYIKNEIDNNRPVLCAGKTHAFVVYGYDDEYVYHHSGFSDYSELATSWDRIHYATQLIITEDHVHSNNYYSTSLNKYLCGCTEISLNSSGTIVLDKSNYTTYYRIKFTATSKMYVSLSTLIEEYDTRFLYISSTTTYTYNDDIDPDGEYSNYNACISIAEMNTGDTLEFTLDLSSVPIDTTLNSFTIILETEEV